MIDLTLNITMKTQNQQKLASKAPFSKIMNGQEKQTFNARPNAPRTSIVASNIFSSGMDLVVSNLKREIEQ